MTQQISIKTGNTMNALYVFRSSNGVPSKVGQPLILKRDSGDDDRCPPDQRLRKFRHIMYCGSHGVIGIDKDSEISWCRRMYQLPIDQITEKFEFQKMGSCPFSKYEMKYLPQRDTILALKLNGNGTLGDCHQYNFQSKKWHPVFGSCSKKMSRSISTDLQWKYCYDHEDDVLYFVSNLFHVVQYSMGSGKWQLIMDGIAAPDGVQRESISRIWMNYTGSFKLLCGLVMSTVMKEP